MGDAQDGLSCTSHSKGFVKEELLVDGACDSCVASGADEPEKRLFFPYIMRYVECPYCNLLFVLSRAC